MTPLTKTENKLYRYLKKYKGVRTSEQICKYMKWEGVDQINYCSRVLHEIEDKGWIEIIPPNMRRAIRILDLDKQV